MKKTWEEPEIMVQEFTANEYVAACGQTEYGDYLFECTAPAGVVYQETNGKEGLQRTGFNRDTVLGGYTPCNETHRTKNRADFVEGYVRHGDGSVQNVTIWKGENNDNVHCIPSLPQDHWEVLKS